MSLLTYSTHRGSGQFATHVAWRLDAGVRFTGSAWCKDFEAMFASAGRKLLVVSHECVQFASF